MRIKTVVSVLLTWLVGGCIGHSVDPAVDTAIGVLALGATVAAGSVWAEPKSRYEDCAARGESPGVCDMNANKEAKQMAGWQSQDQRNEKLAADFDEYFDKTKQREELDSHANPVAEFPVYVKEED
jgi:hypothetical protein